LVAIDDGAAAGNDGQGASQQEKVQVQRQINRAAAVSNGTARDGERRRC